MNDPSEIPYDFKVSVFPEYVRSVTASAIISAQYVEKVYKLMCLILLPKDFRYSVEDLLSGNSAKTRQTLGMIKVKLKDSIVLDQSFIDRFSDYIQRRNRIVHGLFADTFNSESDIHLDSPSAQKYVAECEWVAEEGAQLVEVGFGIFRGFGEVFESNREEHPQIREMLRSFDEFHALGNRYISSKFKTYLATKNNRYKK